MKKLIVFLAIIIVCSLSANAAVMSYKSASAKNGSKPMAVLVYADWAEQVETALLQYKKTEKKLSKLYNFVELNIAHEDAKAFNDVYIINIKLPYILLLRSNGKFSMLISRDCALSSSCTVDKMRTFLR